MTIRATKSGRSDESCQQTHSSDKSAPYGMFDVFTGCFDGVESSASLMIDLEKYQWGTAHATLATTYPS